MSKLDVIRGERGISLDDLMKEIQVGLGLSKNKFMQSGQLSPHVMEAMARIYAASGSNTHASKALGIRSRTIERYRASEEFQVFFKHYCSELYKGVDDLLRAQLREYGPRLLKRQYHLAMQEKSLSVAQAATSNLLDRIGLLPIKEKGTLAEFTLPPHIAEALIERGRSLAETTENPQRRITSGSSNDGSGSSTATQPNQGPDSEDRSQGPEEAQG